MGRRTRLSEDAMNQSIFGDNSDFVMRYMETQLEDFGYEYDNYLSRSIKSSMDYISDEYRQREIRDELRRKRVKQRNMGIEALTDFNSLRNANVVTQRAIMAMPELRELFNGQDLDGYSGSYKADTRGVGLEDYEYRKATDGMLMTDENGDGYVWHFLDDIEPGDRAWKQYEKEDILSTWDFIREQRKLSKKDFTNTRTDDSDMNR